MKRYKLTLGYLFILFVFAFSCRPEGEVVRADLQSFTPLEQSKIGDVLSRHITDTPSRYNLYRPEQYQQMYSYLNKDVLRTIVTTMGVKNRDVFDWQVFVIRDEESMTAFTLPGGKIYISSAFLKIIQSEGQLMSVLSHEMFYSDYSMAVTKLQEEHSGLILGDLIFNNPVDQKDAMVETLQNEAYLADKVRQADIYSINLLCPFQYKADGISDIIKNVSDEDYPLEWLNTRPEYPGRRDTLVARANICGIGTIEENRYKDNVLNLLD